MRIALRIQFPIEAIESHPAYVSGVPHQIVANTLQVLCSQRHSLLSERDYRHELIGTKHVLHQLPDMVKVLTADLDEHASRWMKQIACEQHSVSQIGQI